MIDHALIHATRAMLISMTFIAGKDMSKSSNSVIFIEAANDYFREGNVRYLEKDYQSAAVAYQEAIRIYPGEAMCSLCCVWSTLVEKWCVVLVLMCDNECLFY